MNHTPTPTVELADITRRAWRIVGSVIRHNWKISSTFEIEEVLVGIDEPENGYLFYNNYDAAVEAKNIFVRRLGYLAQEVVAQKITPGDRIKMMFSRKLRRLCKLRQGFLNDIEDLCRLCDNVSAKDIVDGKFPHITFRCFTKIPVAQHPILAKGAKLYTVNTHQATDGIKFDEHEIVGHRIHIISGRAWVNYKTSSGRGFEHTAINNNSSSDMLYEKLFDNQLAAETYARECAQKIYDSVKQWL